jgi:hypothetical protein
MFNTAESRLTAFHDEIEKRLVGGRHEHGGTPRPPPCSRPAGARGRPPAARSPVSAEGTRIRYRSGPFPAPGFDLVRLTAAASLRQAWIDPRGQACYNKQALVFAVCWEDPWPVQPDEPRHDARRAPGT